MNLRFKVTEWGLLSLSLLADLAMIGFQITEADVDRIIERELIVEIE